MVLKHYSRFSHPWNSRFGSVSNYSSCILYGCCIITISVKNCMPTPFYFLPLFIVLIFFTFTWWSYRSMTAGIVVQNIGYCIVSLILCIPAVLDVETMAVISTWTTADDNETYVLLWWQCYKFIMCQIAACRKGPNFKTKDLQSHVFVNL